MADDDLESRLAPSGRSELEKKVEKSDWSIWNVVKDTLLYSPLGALAYLIGGPASLLTPIGLGIGKLIANKKKKKKTTWKEMRRTLAVGNFGGALAYWAYSIPDYIIGAPVSLAGKIVKTLLFNPIMTTPWIAWYRSSSYIVDKYGVWDTFKSLFNFKIFKYIKESYDNDLKKKLLPSVAEAFLTLAPIHFYSMNYVQNPTYRVGIGTMNDILFSMIAGEEGLLRTVGRKFKAPKPKKEPAPQPYQLPAQGGYSRAA